jgi:glutaminyl-peptide cyclotransferase
VAGASQATQGAAGEKRFVIRAQAKRKCLMAGSALMLLLALAGCSQTTAPAPKETKASMTLPNLAEAGPPPADSGPLPSVDGARAFQYAKEIVAFGPRPIGSASHKKLEDYIYAHLKGDLVEDDYFMADTPAGKLPVRNIIAKFPGTRAGVIVIAGHYDTNYPLKDTGYVGANDGGSSTAILLEVANQLHGKKREGYSVWLLWTDGEEAVKEWTGEDNTYGARHLAEKWGKDGTLKQIKAFLLADMIGDADLNIDRDANSTQWLEDYVYKAAQEMGYQSHFYGRTVGMVDDHQPFVQRGVPCADLIDFDYGYNNVFWHTPQDTVDKLSPKSFEIVGDVLLETVRLLERAPDAENHSR